MKSARILLMAQVSKEIIIINVRKSRIIAQQLLLPVLQQIQIIFILEQVIFQNTTVGSPKSEKTAISPKPLRKSKF